MQVKKSAVVEGREPDCLFYRELEYVFNPSEVPMPPLFQKFEDQDGKYDHMNGQGTFFLGGKMDICPLVGLPLLSLPLETGSTQDLLGKFSKRCYCPWTFKCELDLNRLLKS